MLDEEGVLGSVCDFISFLLGHMCDIPQWYVVSCAGCELNSPSWFPDQGAPSPPGERDCCGDRSSGLLRRCWLSEPSCRLHVSVPSGAGVSARPGDCTALGLPCAHTARREPGLIMLELHVSSPVHFGEYIDTKWDYDLIRPLSGAFAGSPALSGQSPASLGQHLVPWWSGPRSPLSCPQQVPCMYCCLSATTLPGLPSLLGLAVTHTPGSASCPQPRITLLGNGRPLPASRTPVLPQQHTPWPDSESPAFFSGVLPPESELWEGRECARLATLVSPVPGMWWGLRTRLNRASECFVKTPHF